MHSPLAYELAVDLNRSVNLYVVDGVLCRLLLRHAVDQSGSVARLKCGSCPLVNWW